MERHEKTCSVSKSGLAQGFARGDSYDRLVRNLRKRFDRVNRNDAYRLVYTEGTYVMVESTMQPFKDDFEQYRLSPVLDGRTCPICRGLREQVFLISERQPGTTSRLYIRGVDAAGKSSLMIGTRGLMTM